MRSQTTETDIIESILHLDKKCCINDVSRKPWSCAKSMFSITVKNYSTYVSYRVSILMFLKLLKITPIHKKGSLHIAYQITGPCLSPVSSAKFLNILHVTVFKVYVKHLIYSLKINSGSIKTGLQSWQC